mmetsp:Transcript_20788/g.45787  ORF Transcript_20788/g.45787 Transcript_20788/m.45787 type:complete len:230 (+) Transcript_20788:307-996(+)
MFPEGFRNHRRGIGLALRANDSGLTLELGAGHDELLPLGILLRDLLLFDGPCKLLPIGQVRDGHVVHEDPELACPLHNGLANGLRDVLSLRQQLLSVVLSNRGLHYLVRNGRQDSLIIVFSERLVDVGQTVHVRLEKHAAMNRHSLEVLRARGCLNELRPQPNVVPLGLHEPRNPEVCAFFPDLVIDTTHHVQHYDPFAAIYIKKAKGRKCCKASETKTHARDRGQHLV